MQCIPGRLARNWPVGNKILCYLQYPLGEGQNGNSRQKFETLACQTWIAGGRFLQHGLGD